MDGKPAYLHHPHYQGGAYGTESASAAPCHESSSKWWSVTPRSTLSALESSCVVELSRSLSLCLANQAPCKHLSELSSDVCAKRIRGTTWAHRPELGESCENATCTETRTKTKSEHALDAGVLEVCVDNLGVEGHTKCQTGPVLQAIVSF